ncbi:hypothetical protein BLNAU_10890 [Blattamonas nauphoetae]|uniref:Uncharacterized protein n=1 Tax=Blattamonas nauphoetae TaxID=2049346 RepID=A0ABQ9XNS8_9EUKA|nr:hypothetical protein BLNAU_10890 [Blattamonas nauphoetae]
MKIKLFRISRRSHAPTTSPYTSGNVPPALLQEESSLETVDAITVPESTDSLINLSGSDFSDSAAPPTNHNTGHYDRKRLPNRQDIAPFSVSSQKNAGQNRSNNSAQASGDLIPLGRTANGTHVPIPSSATGLFAPKPARPSQESSLLVVGVNNSVLGTFAQTGGTAEANTTSSSQDGQIESDTQILSPSLIGEDLYAYLINAETESGTKLPDSICKMKRMESTRSDTNDNIFQRSPDSPEPGYSPFSWPHAYAYIDLPSRYSSPTAQDGGKEVQENDFSSRPFPNARSTTPSSTVIYVDLENLPTADNVADSRSSSPTQHLFADPPTTPRIWQDVRSQVPNRQDTPAMLKDETNDQLVGSCASPPTVRSTAEHETMPQVSTPCAAVTLPISPQQMASPHNELVDLANEPKLMLRDPSPSPNSESQASHTNQELGQSPNAENAHSAEPGATTGTDAKTFSPQQMASPQNALDDLANEPKAMLKDPSPSPPSPNSENQDSRTDTEFHQLTISVSYIDDLLPSPKGTKNVRSTATETKDLKQSMAHVYAISVNGSSFMVVFNPPRCLRVNLDSLTFAMPHFIAYLSPEKKSELFRRCSFVLKLFNPDFEIVDDMGFSNRVDRDHLALPSRQSSSQKPPAKKRTSGLDKAFGSINVKSPFIREVRREILSGSESADSETAFAMLTLELPNIDAELAAFLTRLVVISGCQAGLEAGQDAVVSCLFKYRKAEWTVFDDHLSSPSKRPSKSRKKSSAEHGTGSMDKVVHRNWVHPNDTK